MTPTPTALAILPTPPPPDPAAHPLALVRALRASLAYRPDDRLTLAEGEILLLEGLAEAYRTVVARTGAGEVRP